MRLIGVAYCVALGWYVRASGLDKELWELARESYDATVLHTAHVLRRAEVTAAVKIEPEEVSA